MVCWCIIMMHAIRFLIKPWDKFDEEGIRQIKQKFALDPDGLKIVFYPEYRFPELKSFWQPVRGAYLFDKELTGKMMIFIDTRFVRSERALVETLLHEICHHNQHIQGRMIFGRRGRYSQQPIEREAENFALAWKGPALRIYRGLK